MIMAQGKDRGWWNRRNYEYIRIEIVYTEDFMLTSREGGKANLLRSWTLKCSRHGCQGTEILGIRFQFSRKNSLDIFGGRRTRLLKKVALFDHFLVYIHVFSLPCTAQMKFDVMNIISWLMLPIKYCTAAGYM